MATATTENMATATTEKKVSKDIVLTNVVLSYPKQLAVPKAFQEGGPKKYSVTAIMNETEHGPLLAQLREEINTLITTTYKVKSLKPALVCLKNGPTERPDTPGYEEGTWYIGASSDTKVKVVDRLKQEMAADDPRIVGGCRGNVVVNIYAQKPDKFGPRINASLRLVQYLRPDRVFGVGEASTDILPDLPDEPVGKGEVDI